jgi:hypothetical protein
MPSSPAPVQPQTPPATLSKKTGAIVSVLVVLPLLCLPRLLAGDFPSHVYNAWLANQIHRGELPGLAISWQTSNIAADVLLAALLRISNVYIAEHLVGALTVLVLFWGSYRFIRALSGRDPLWLAPLIAVLTYGFVFQMGLLNFCLSLGFCFFLFAQGLKEPKDWVAMVCLAALAWVSHPLPLLWLAGSLAFYGIAAWCNALYRALVLALAVLFLGVINHLMVTHLLAGWQPHGWMEISGAAQLEIFGKGYHRLALFYVALTAVLLGVVLFTRREQRMQLVLCFFLLQAAAVFLLPYQALVPGSPASFDLITARFSLISGVALLALLNFARSTSPARMAIGALTAAYFVLLIADTRSLDALSTNLDATVRTLPAGARVLMGNVKPPHDGAVPVHFMLERSCIGHCYAYANFEPSTGHFRVRAIAPNPYVIPDNSMVAELNSGKHVLREFEEPLYLVQACTNDPEKFCVSTY